MQLSINRHFQALLILFVALGVYYPAIFTPPFGVDDPGMIEALAGDKFNFWKIFAPAGGFYYRPLILSSYHADLFLWGEELSFWHLENILLHAFNAVLVFWVAERYLKHFKFEAGIAPLFAGLFFAIHPIVTESVNWISGRTDILASFFVLLLTGLLLIATQRREAAYLCGCVLLMVCAIMSKEVMVFYLPVAFLLLWFLGSLRKALLFSAPFVILGLFYALLRIILLDSTAEGVGDLLQHWRYGPVETISITMKVFGFYAKKLFMPTPLNFVIREVADHYAYVGMVVTLFATACIIKKVRCVYPLLIAFWMMAPAIMVALAGVNWTVVAERYIYLSTAFLALFLAGLLAISWRDRRYAFIFSAILFLSLFPATYVTADRNLQWQDGAALFEQSLTMDPNAPVTVNCLAAALTRQNKDDEAVRVLRDAIATEAGRRYEKLYISLANVYLNRKEFDQAVQVLKEGQIATRKDYMLLRMVAQVKEKQLIYGDSVAGDSEFVETLAKIYAYLARVSNDGALSYRAGQLFLSVDDKKTAKSHFKKAYADAEEDDYYRQAAHKLYNKLSLQSVEILSDEE